MTPRRSPDVMRMTSGVLRHVALPAILGAYAVMVLQRTTDGPTRRSQEISGAQFAEVTHPIIEQDSGQPWLTVLSVVGGSMQINSGGEGFSLGAVSRVSIAGADILCARATCTGLTAGRGTTGWAILANYATTPFGSIGPGFTAINAGGGGLTINQGGAEGVTCSGALSARATVTNGVVTHC